MRGEHLGIFGKEPAKVSNIERADHVPVHAPEGLQGSFITLHIAHIAHQNGVLRHADVAQVDGLCQAVLKVLEHNYPSAEHRHPHNNPDPDVRLRQLIVFKVGLLELAACLWAAVLCCTALDLGELRCF